MSFIFKYKNAIKLYNFIITDFFFTKLSEHMVLYVLHSARLSQKKS